MFPIKMLYEFMKIRKTTLEEERNKNPISEMAELLTSTKAQSV